MPDYSTNIGGAQTGFQGVSPVSPKRDSTAKQSAFLDLAAKFAGGVAKGYAVGSAKDTAGVNLTNVDVESSQQLFDDEVEIATRVAQREAGDNELSEAQRMDIRDTAIKDLDLSTKEIKNLLANNRIKSTEAQARIDMMLSEKMSNPFLAMYEEDFRNTVAQFTGDIGLSPEEKRAQAKAKAFSEAQFELDTLTGQILTGNPSISEERARQMAQQQVNFQKDTEMRQARVTNGEIVDAEEIKMVVSEGVNLAYTNITSILNSNMDADGKVSVQGLQDAKYAASYFIKNQRDLIERSRLSVDEKKYQRSRLMEEAALMDKIAKDMSSGEFYKLQAQLGADVTQAEFYRKYPLAAMFSKNGDTELAKLALNPNSIETLKIFGVAADLNKKLKPGTYFIGGSERPLNPFDPANPTQDDLVLGEAIMKGQDISEYVKTPEQKAYVEKMQQLTPGLNTKGKVAEGVVEGNPEDVKRFNQSFQTFIQTQANKFLPPGASAGTVKISESVVPNKAVQKMRENDPFNPRFVTWDTDENLGSAANTIADYYKVVYDAHKANPKEVPNPVKAMNNMLAGGEMKAFADPKYDNPDNRAVSDVERNKKLQAEVDRAKGALAGLTEDQLISEMESMNPGKLRDAIEAELSSRVEGSMNNG